MSNEELKLLIRSLERENAFYMKLLKSSLWPHNLDFALLKSIAETQELVKLLKRRDVE